MTIVTTLGKPTTPEVAISFFLEFFENYGDKKMKPKSFSLFFVEFCCP
jgi:hypothetical protein